MLGTIVGGLMGIGQTAFNNWMSQEAAKEARAENYRYNEMAAENANKRSRQNYMDFYSPEALMRQYKDAGLSPSLMFGGTPGQGGMTSPTGAGVAGPQAQVMPYDFLSAAQAGNLMAQTEKTKAETENIQKDTDIKKIEERIREMDWGQYADEMRVINLGFTNPDGSETSIFQKANEYMDLDDFLNFCQKEYGIGSKETEQKHLRKIYYAANKFEHDIKILSSEKTSASFQEKIVNAMSSKGFVEMNARAAVKYLEANIETAELNKTQKEAWNNMLDRLGNGTTRDIIIVLGMLLNNAMMNYKLPGIHTTNINNTNNNFE